MKDFKPSLGNTARGTAFFPRKREIDKIFDLLEINANIYLSAPRRVGKTSILKHLEDAENDNGYYFIYVITESIYSVNDFYKALYNELLNSKAIQKLSKLSKGLTELLSSVITNIEVSGIKTKEQAPPDYHELFIHLLSKIEKGIGRVVIMIDEFPQTLHNINKKHGAIEARRFIQLNRELRHNKTTDEKVTFIYTGSIALYPMAEKIGSLNDVNDLITVEVKPLTRKEAKELLSLLSNRKKVVITPNAIEYMFDEIKWFIPFHIQMVYQELEDIFYNKESELDNTDINTAINRTIAAKNKAMFEPYFSRLKGLLDTNEYLFAMEILMYTAKNDCIEKAVCFDFAQKHTVDKFKEILGELCEDGYLYESDGNYRYTSPILQLWCKKNNDYGI